MNAEFLKTLITYANQTAATYYDTVPTDAVYPYACINSPLVLDADGCDSLEFYLDIWADDKKPTATAELETLCDSFRRAFSAKIFTITPQGAAHISFDRQITVAESDFDLCHRRQIYTARIFYKEF